MQILFQECLYYNSFERIRKYHHYYLSTVSSPEVNASSTCIYFLSLLGSIDSGAFSLHSFLGRKPAFTSGHIIAINPFVAHCASGATTKTGGQRNRA